jgi:hypothetical protein
MGGISGFQNLQILRELGSRPFFLFVIPFIGYLIYRNNALPINLTRFNIVLSIYIFSFIGFLIYGIDLTPFGGKDPMFQFFAQGILFLLGFSAFVLSSEIVIKEDLFIRVIRNAILINLIFISIDQMAMFLDFARPFQDIFYSKNVLEREMPLGLFSEPSFFGAYFAILVPLYLYKARLLKVLFVSIFCLAYFYIYKTRTFFIVFIPIMIYLFQIRYKSSFKILLAIPILMALLYIASVQLGIFSVEENLSSAYRLGNAYSYFIHALKNNIIFGYGFGSSHFIYPNLEPIFGVLSSIEYNNMISGIGEERALVFNLWVRYRLEQPIQKQNMLVRS